jgi:hypothetical protein
MIDPRSWSPATQLVPISLDDNGTHQSMVMIVCRKGAVSTPFWHTITLMAFCCADGHGLARLPG